MGVRVIGFGDVTRRNQESREPKMLHGGPILGTDRSAGLRDVRVPLVP